MTNAIEKTKDSTTSETKSGKKNRDCRHIILLVFLMTKPTIIPNARSDRRIANTMAM
jgi:hypothetical protein